MNRSKLGIAFLFFILAGSSYFIVRWIRSKPKSYNWTERYQPDGVLPYDSRIFMNLLKRSNQFLPENTIQSRTELKKFFAEQKTEKSTLVFIGLDYYPEKENQENLLNWVSRGNTLLVISKAGQEGFVSRFVEDTCLQRAIPPIKQFSDSLIDCYLYHASFRQSNPVKFDYRFKGKREVFDWHCYDGNLFCARSSLVPLGYIGNGYVNFTLQSYGKGLILLHCNPIMFTNYQLTDTSRLLYAKRVLSYIPDGPVYLDRASRFQIHSSESETDAPGPLAFILANRSLRWAYYIILAMVLVYVFFGLRRQQRVIPVIEPLRNSTAAFVKTMGHLMMRQKDHSELFKNQVRYFHAFVKEKYRINTLKATETDIEILSGRSGVPITLIRKLLQTAEKLSLYVEIGEQDALFFHELLSEFFKSCRK